MRQKSHLIHDPFFGLKGLDHRPASVTTEIVDTDWDEEEDIVSEIEDEPVSPRDSLNSVRDKNKTQKRGFELRMPCHLLKCPLT